MIVGLVWPKIGNKTWPRQNTGWWFGTFFLFPYIENHHPNWLIFFRGLKPPTRNMLILAMTRKTPTTHWGTMSHAFYSEMWGLMDWTAPKWPKCPVSDWRQGGVHHGMYWLRQAIERSPKIAYIFMYIYIHINISCLVTVPDFEMIRPHALFMAYSNIEDMCSISFPCFIDIRIAKDILHVLTCLQYTDV